MSETPSQGQLRRRRWGRALVELHVQLRTEGDTPARKALSVAVGTAVGCLPFYGLHLLFCAGLAKLFRLNQLRTYLAASIGNPLTFPFLLYVELGVGSWVTSGRWPALSFAELRAADPWALGRDILVGGLVVGAVLGAVLGAVAYAIGSRWQTPPRRARLREMASRRFVEAGIVQWEFVRGKLRRDPVYFALLESGLLPRSGLLVDLGCGRGILLALLAAARELEPSALALLGVERRRKLVAVAAGALGGEAEIREADLASYAPPPCRAVVLLDVLHYLDARGQGAIIERAVASLEPGGVLVLREADAGRGWRFAVTRAAERLAALARGHVRQRFRYRSAAAWRELLEGLGLTVTSAPMWAGTPFGNVLLAARKGAAATASKGDLP